MRQVVLFLVMVMIMDVVAYLIVVCIASLVVTYDMLFMLRCKSIYSRRPKDGA